MTKKLILVVAAIGEVATKFAGMLTNESLQVKALCPPRGLQGLLDSLEAGLSHAEAVLFTPDAFSRPNKVAPVDAVKALLEAKPSLRVLVFRVGGMDGLNDKVLLKAGAASVYIGKVPSIAEFSGWVETNVFGPPMGKAYLEKKPGKVKMFSIPSSLSDDVKDAMQSEQDGFPLDDSELPESNSWAGILGTRDRPEKPNGKNNIHKSGLSKKVRSKVSGTVSRSSVSVGEASSNELLQTVAKLRQKVQEHEQVIMDLIVLFQEAEKYNASLAVRAREIVAHSIKKHMSSPVAVSPTEKELQTSSAVPVPQKRTVSVVQVSKRSSRVGFLGHEIELSNSSAELLEFLVSANGRRVTIHDITERFDVKESAAYVRIWYLIKCLNKHSRGFGKCVKNDRNKGYYIEHKLPS